MEEENEIAGCLNVVGAPDPNWARRNAREQAAHIMRDEIRHLEFTKWLSNVSKLAEFLEANDANS